MNKKQKTILMCLAIVAIIAFSGYLLRGCLHESPDEEQIDTLQYAKDRAKREADYKKSKSDSANNLYEKDLKNLNSPADSVERENVWSKYWRAIQKDSNGTATTR